MKKVRRVFGLCFIGSLLILLISVGCSNFFDLKISTPTLKSLEIFGENAMQGKIDVAYEKKHLTSNDIVAKFNYGNMRDQTIAVTVKNGTLDVGLNTVTLSIPAQQGRYKAWSKNIVIIRDTSNLTLKSLSIFGNPVTKNAVSVGNEHTKLLAENIIAKFDYATETDKQVTVTVEGGTVNLIEGANTVKLSIPAIDGVHKGWSESITITRNSDPNLTLKSLVIHGKDAMSGSVDLGYDKSSVTQSDVIARFDYGTYSDQVIAVNLSKESLSVTNNTLKLFVPAVNGKYKAWDKEITIMRDTSDLVLKSLSIFGNTVVDNAVSVGNQHIVLDADDVVARFDYGTKQNQILPVNVEGRTVNLIEGANTIKLFILANPSLHKGWEQTISLTRDTDFDLTLKSLTIHGKDAMSGNLDLSYSTSTIGQENVIATFDYGSFTNKTIDVTVTNGSLSLGNNTVTLSIPALNGTYKELLSIVVDEKEIEFVMQLKLHL